MVDCGGSIEAAWNGAGVVVTVECCLPEQAPFLAVVEAVTGHGLSTTAMQLEQDADGLAVGHAKVSMVLARAASIRGGRTTTRA